MLKVRQIKKSRLVAAINWFRRRVGGGNIDAITLYPFVLYRRRRPAQITMAHELVHIRQIQFYGFFTFYMTYAYYYLSNLIRYKSGHTAYRLIPWEIEAYWLAGRGITQIDETRFK